VVRDDYPALGIHGNAAPVRSPVVARIFDVMAAELRRGVRALITSALEVDPANHLINRRDTPHIALDQIGFAWRMVTVEGLRRRALLGLRSPLRDGNLVDLM